MEKPSFLNVWHYLVCAFKGHDPLGQFCGRCGWFIP